MASKIEKDIAARKGETITSSLPRYTSMGSGPAKMETKEYPTIEKKKYMGAPADKTRVSKQVQIHKKVKNERIGIAEAQEESATGRNLRAVRQEETGRE